MLSSDRPDINFTFDGKGIVGWTRDEMKIWDITALNSPSLPGLNVQTKESLSICTSNHDNSTWEQRKNSRSQL